MGPLLTFLTIEDLGKQTGMRARKLWTVNLNTVVVVTNTLFTHTCRINDARG